MHRALEWIDTLAPGERYFLTYLPVAGHHPYDTPEPGPFPEHEDSDRYLVIKAVPRSRLIGEWLYFAPTIL